MRLREFAPASGGNGGNYLKALASAWYNGTFNTGDLHKGIKSQEDVERILERGIHCGDGKIRKYSIGYNAGFDGVEIQSDDHYEYADYDDAGNDIDSRTGKPWGPYDVVEFSDGDLSESLNEFAFDDEDDKDERPKFLPWNEFIGDLKAMLGDHFDVQEKVIKSTIQARFVPHDPMEYGPTMLYSYYEARAGRGKGAVSTRGAIQVGKYYPNTSSLGDRNYITSFNILKGHPFERHFDLTGENVQKIADIIVGNTAGAYQMPQQQGVAEMDGDGAGRDGSNRKSHSTYGSRDKHTVSNGPDVHLDPKSMMTSKQMQDRALDTLKKTMSKPENMAVLKRLKTKEGVAEGELDEKSTSQAQFRTMAAAAHNPAFARKVGIKQSVAREFNKADRGQSYKSLPKKVN